MSEISTYPLRLPRSLKDAVQRLSKEDGTSINQFVAIAAAEKVSALETARYFEERKSRLGRATNGLDKSQFAGISFPTVKPSHRATTALARQFPSTFTDVRAISKRASTPKRMLNPSAGRWNVVSVPARTTSAVLRMVSLSSAI